MDTKQKFRLGLQWGALAWLGYVVVQYGVWVIPIAAAGHFPSGHALKMAPLILAAVLFAARSRWARAAIALGVAVQFALGVETAAFLYKPYVWPEIGTYAAVSGVLGCLGLAMCLPLVPLLAWPLDAPRATLAMLARGRFRDAWVGSGGVVALLTAVPVVTLNRTLLDALDLQLAPLLFTMLALALLRYGDVMLAWPLKGRQVV